MLSASEGRARLELGQGRPAVVGAAGEAVAIDADEHLRLELGEAVDDALGSEIGSARRSTPPRGWSSRASRRPLSGIFGR